MKTIFLAISLALLASMSCKTAPVPASQTKSSPDTPQPTSLAPLRGDTYSTVSMRSKEIAKDRDRGVIMFTPEQREAARMVIVNGNVFTSRGAPFGSKTNGSGDVSNYVMDKSGNFYWFDEKSTPTIRHSSIFDQMPIAGAGNITITKSQITFIDSDSGHYPSGPLFPNVKTQLIKDGVDFSTVEIGKIKND